MQWESQDPEMQGNGDAPSALFVNLSFCCVIMRFSSALAVCRNGVMPHSISYSRMPTLHQSTACKGFRLSTSCRLMRVCLPHGAHSCTETECDGRQGRPLGLQALPMAAQPYITLVINMVAPHMQ